MSVLLAESDFYS